MAYSFISDTHGSASGSASSINAPAVAANPGSLLVIAARYVNATAQTVTMSDNVGGNVYNPIASYYNSPNTNGVSFFYALNSASGFVTYTANYTAACTNRAIYVGQYTGLTNLITSNGQENESPGTGADAYTSGPAPVGIVPAMMWGFIDPVHNFNITPSSGTGFTARSACWDFALGTNFALAEDERVIVTGNLPATFTVAEASGRYVFMAAFQEVIIQQIVSTGIFVTP